jgi:hypothetical protein
MEIRRCYGMEMNVEKTKVMRISKQLSRTQIMIDKNNWRMWITSTILEMMQKVHKGNYIQD